MAQFVTLDSRPAKAHSAPSREALLARWEAQSRRAETEALSAIPDAALGRRDPGAAARPPTGAQADRTLAAAVADAQRDKATFSRYELTRMISRYLPDYLGGLSGEEVTGLLEEPGDLLVIDEASMVSTADLAAVEAVATRQGAKILLTGDTEQLSAPQAGGAMRLLAGEHGDYQLRTVRRFEQEWERDASLRLRDGDADVLAEYDQRGRIHRCPPIVAPCRSTLRQNMTATCMSSGQGQVMTRFRQARSSSRAAGPASCSQSPRTARTALRSSTDPLDANYWQRGR
jgi:AAA domain